jgi:hypothetical protein
LESHKNWFQDLNESKERADQKTDFTEFNKLKGYGMESAESLNSYLALFLIRLKERKLI